MSRRKYSDREKAEALAVYDSCGNLTETARITGIPDSTLCQWVQSKCGVNDDIPDMREFKKKELAEKLDIIAHQCAGLLPGRLPEANVREIVGAMGQSIEKSQLLRGRPTEITESQSSTEFAILQAIKDSAKTSQITEENAAIGLFARMKDHETLGKAENWPAKFRDLLSKKADSEPETVSEASQ